MKRERLDSRIHMQALPGYGEKKQSQKALLPWLALQGEKGENSFKK